MQRSASCIAQGITYEEGSRLHAYLEEESKGHPPSRPAALLRDLRSVRRYLMTNRFTANSSVFRLPIEPPRYSLESAVMRAFVPSFGFISVGGGVDDLGAGRLMNVGMEWQEIVRDLLKRSDLFVCLIPSGSAGVQWEVSELRRAGLLDKTMWIMPPADAVPSGEHEWNSATFGLAPMRIALPRFREAGGFFFLDCEGVVRHEEPFSALWEGRIAEVVQRLN